MTEIIIDEVYPKASVNPVIITFQNAYTNEKFSSTECKLLSNDYSETKTIFTSVNDMLYIGEEKEDLLKKILLVRDKVTGKVRVIEASEADLKPDLKTDLEAISLNETSNLELSRKFGSKKQKRRVEQREKLKVNTEVVAKQMKKVTANVTAEKIDMSLYIKSNAEDLYVPPIDREATKVEDVYSINKILSENEYENIFEEIKDKDYNLELIPIIKAIVSKRELPDKLKVIALYGSTLMKMYGSNCKDFSKKSFVICNSSSTLNDIVLNNFAINSGPKRTRPAPLKDKALCHAIVFMLIINNFKLSLDEISATVKLTNNTVVNKVKAIGAHITSSGDKKNIELKLPLNTLTGFKRRQSAKF